MPPACHPLDVVCRLGVGDDVDTAHRCVPFLCRLTFGQGDGPAVGVAAGPSVFCCLDGDGWMDVVAPGFSERVDEGGWEEFGYSVGGELDVPARSVDEAMVMFTQEAEISYVCWSAVIPVDD